ncbi:MAG: SusC/RagA family TonB-linked outer membrane protein [Gemmatimonadaceae bacterium]
MKRSSVSAWLLAGVLGALLAHAGRVQAQTTAVIAGKVTAEAGRPIGGASVLFPDFNIGANTSADGSYSITVPSDRVKGQTLIIVARYIGYAPVRKQVTLRPGTQEQSFSLTRDALQLNEVVVTGTGSATEVKKIPFAIGIVSADQLKETPSVTALGGLAGKIPGVQVLTGSGEPGAPPAVRLRAATSLTGTQDPLIIIDGTISHGTLADINSEDIERVEVVKGAAASSLYGSNAANGVIQIFTKRGANNPEGELVVTVRNEIGRSYLGKTLPRAEAHSFRVDAQGQYLRTPSGDRIPEPDGIADNAYLTVNDPQKSALRPGQFITNYISVGQRKGTTNYNASIQNTSTEGVLFGIKGYNRQNFRVNLDQVFNSRLDVNMGAFYGKSNNDQVAQGPGSPFFALTFVEPDVDLFAKNPDGSAFIAKIPDRVANASNPLYALTNIKNKTDRTRFTGTGKARYRLFDWLTAEGNFNYDEESNSFTQLTPFGFLDATGISTDGNLFKQNDRGRSYNTGAAITSIRKFGPVTNTTRGSFSYDDQISSAFSLNATQLTVTKTPEFTAVSNGGGLLTPLSNSQTIRTRGSFLVTTFDIQDRYILDGLIRKDESSLFGSAARSKNYYRYSGAWRVSENFRLPGVDEFRLRASKGTAGLRPIFNAQYETFAIVSGAPEKVNLGNRFLQPAHSTETEYGLNFDFLGRFHFEYTNSDKITRDQILLVPLSAATGYRNQWQNAGTLKGRTQEAALGGALISRPGFGLNLNITADRTRQRITQLDVPDFLTGPFYQGSEDNAAIFRIAAGETFGVMYGTRTVRNLAQLYQDPAKKALSGAGQRWHTDNLIVNEEGYLVERSGYRTVNERPIAFVNEQGESKVQIGDVNPDFNMAFNTQMNLRGLSVSALVNWVKGGNVYNGTRQWPFFENRDAIYDQRGKPAEERKPQQYYNFFYNSIDPIDFFVEDGTYLKLKELAVNYTFPTAAVTRMRALGFSGVKVGVVGRNLFTKTKYTGYDPEVSGLSGDPYSFRFDGFSYPNFRTFTGLIELAF